MSISKKIRVYVLAKDLKQDAKRIIEDLRREGADVDVPSNSVSVELAEKVRNRYFPITAKAPLSAIKVIKKGTKDITTTYSKKPIDISRKQKICQYCSKIISPKHFIKRYKEHIFNECPKKPVFSINSMLKYFDLMTERTNSMNNKKLTSIDLASYLIDSQLISNFNILYSPIHNFTDDCPVATIKNGAKKLKVAIINELFNLYYPCRTKLGFLYVKDNYFKKLRNKDFEIVHGRLKKVSSLFIKIQSEKNFRKETFQQIQNKKKITETEEIDWEILPVGDWFNSEEVTVKLFEHFRNIQNKGKWRNKFFDESRINGIFNKLKPETYKTGKKKFEGYVVYFFEWTAKVILECPIYGNATYIISSGKYSWQEIARNSKLEVRTEYSAQVTVINHSETWLERLEQNLRYGL